MIFATGLPRSAGQTLQHCLETLGYRTVHSPGNNLSACSCDPSIDAFVEVFAPIPWIVENFKDPVFIYNCRYPDEWLSSCERVYHKSGDWNHPIWDYEISQFLTYRSDYEDNLFTWFDQLDCRYLEWNIIDHPDWDLLCDFLDCEEPPGPFPNVDQHGRDSSNDTASDCPGFPSPW